MKQKSPARPSAPEIVAWLKKTGTQRTRDGMARYGLPSAKAFGVPVSTMQAYAKHLGRDHELALALWQTGWYEARMVAAFLDEPERVTSSQMDQWCRDFDNWGIVDTVCFHLFDRTAHGFAKVRKWSKLEGEFQKRASFALLACLALHDKQAPDEEFLRCLPLIEAASADERNFVKKGVLWALRLAGRRSAALNAAAVDMAKRLAGLTEPSARWIGRTALKDIASATVLRKFRVQP